MVAYIRGPLVHLRARLTVCCSDIEQDEVLGDTAAIEFKGHLMRLQRQLIALLPKFCLNEKTFKQVRLSYLAWWMYVTAEIHNVISDMLPSRASDS